MANIRKLYEADQTTQLMPQTHEKAVIDNNGTTLESKLGVVTEGVEALQEAYAALTQSDIVVVADHTAVASPQANTIYREQGTTTYSDWMYYDSAWKKMAEYDNAIDDVPVSGSNNLVKSGGVYSKTEDLFFEYNVNEKTNAPVYATASSWRLRNNGTCASNSSFELKKYAVTGGETLILNITKDDTNENSGAFQFQSAASVPSSGTNSNLVGTTYETSFNGSIVVPTNAKYLIVSQLKTNTTNVIKRAYNKLSTFYTDVSKVKNRGVLVRNNVAPNGIYIDGNSIKLTVNGFAIIIDNNIYYIAPQDNTTLYTFTKNANNCYLVIDTSQLGSAGVRTEPTCMSVIGLDTYDETKHIVVAVFSVSYWKFYGTFKYFEKDSDIAVKLDVIPTHNVNAYGIYTAGNSVYVNEDGFGIKYNKSMYYIAPTDLTTTTTFTKTANSNYLVIDVTQLGSANARTNPSTCMSVIAITDYNPERHIVVAVFFKSFWSFVGVFEMFSRYITQNDIPKTSFFNPEAFLLNIAAHRGTFTYPTNTKESIQDACEKGFKYIECDIRMTSDDVPILMHNETVNYMTDGTGTVSEMTWSQISQLHVDAWDGTGEPYTGNDIFVARLVDVLPIIKKYKVVLELDLAGRPNEIFEKCYEICKKYGVLRNIVVTCFNPSVLITNGWTDWGVSGAFSSEVTLSVVQSVNYDNYKKFPYANLSVNKEYITSEICDYVHQQGINIKTWTVESTSEIDTYINMGVDTQLCNLNSLPTI